MDISQLSFFYFCCSFMAKGAKHLPDVSGNVAETLEGISDTVSAFFSNLSKEEQAKYKESKKVGKDFPLQVALAGAIRVALEKLRPGCEEYSAVFDEWDGLLSKAFADPKIEARA